MYYIKIHKSENHTISAEYNIPADIVIFNRQSFVDGEIVDVSIGMTIDELILTANEINYRKSQHKDGIDPPESMLKPRESDSYMDTM